MVKHSWYIPKDSDVYASYVSENYIYTNWNDVMTFLNANPLEITTQ